MRTFGARTWEGTRAAASGWNRHSPFRGLWARPTGFYDGSMRFPTLACVALSLLSLSACGKDDGPANLGQSGTVTVSSPAIPAGGAIPAKFSADQGNVSPPLAWTGIPKGTQEIVVLVDSTTAAGSETPLANWIVYGLAGVTTSLPEGAGLPTPTLTSPAAAKQGKNGAGQLGWTGPAVADGARLYSFWVYALAKPTDLPPGATREAVLNATRTAGVLGSGRLLGSWQK